MEDLVKILKEREELNKQAAEKKLDIREYVSKMSVITEKQKTIEKRILELSERKVPKLDVFKIILPEMYRRISETFPHLTFKQVIEFEKHIRDKPVKVHSGKYGTWEIERNMGMVNTGLEPMTCWSCCRGITPESNCSLRNNYDYDYKIVDAQLPTDRRYLIATHKRTHTSCKFYTRSLTTVGGNGCFRGDDYTTSNMYSDGSVDPMPDSFCFTGEHKMFGYQTEKLSVSEDIKVSDLKGVIVAEISSVESEIQKMTSRQNALEVIQKTLFDKK